MSAAWKLQLGGRSLQQTAKAVLKREKSGKGAVFHLSAVLVTQHRENLVETKRGGELTAAVAASFPIPSNLSKQCSHVT